MDGGGRGYKGINGDRNKKKDLGFIFNLEEKAKCLH